MRRVKLLPSRQWSRDRPSPGHIVEFKIKHTVVIANTAKIIEHTD